MNKVWSILLVLFCNVVVKGPVSANDRPLYFRVGAGIASSADTVFSDVDCTSTSPAALFGCIPGNDGEPIGAYGDLEQSSVLDLGLGYRWHDGFRTEITVSCRPDFQFDGHSNFVQLDPAARQDVTADMNSLSVMLVAEVRPFSLNGRKQMALDPFVMGGIGFARNSLDAMVFTFPDTRTITPDGSHTGFAWTVGTGFVRRLNRNLEFSFLYRFTDLGSAHTDAGTMQIRDIDSGTMINDDITIGGTRADVTVHEVLLGIIWHF